MLDTSMDNFLSKLFNFGEIATDDQASIKQDLKSLGIILYILISG